MSIFERSVTCSFFFQELYSYIDKNSEEKFEDTFLVKIANKGTPLSELAVVAMVTKKLRGLWKRAPTHCSKVK